MWRTYKSKKETGLDPRNVKEIVEDKCSVFDAFYIENLKQAKRELSCFGVSKQYSTSNRMRKKKYVKRLKEPEPVVCDTTSQSTYLTPDKSLRVNKAEDLFDKLLRSSPPLDSPILTKLSNNKNKRKSYSTRKRANVKKMNYSSSGSDKENGQDSAFEQSDVKSHELVIEKEVFNKSDSIENIDQNVSVFASLQMATDKLTPQKNINEIRSSAIGGSPLCSTPFHDKYRGKSIYKFSPILVNRKTIVANKASDCTINNAVTTSTQNSIHPPKFSSANEINDSIKFDGKISGGCSINDDKVSNNIKNDIEKDAYNNSQTDNCNVSGTEISADISENQDTSVILQCTEPQKFLGFSKMNNTNYIEKFERLNNIVGNSSMTYTDNELSCEPLVGLPKTSLKENRESIPSNTTSEVITTDSTDDIDTESYYDTCSENESDKSNISSIKEPIVVIERLSNSVLMKYLNKNDSLTDKSDTSNDFSSGSYNSFDSNNCNITSNSGKTDDMSDKSSISSQDNQAISFVTTRRRNERTNDSFIFSLDDSNSISTVDVDETIVNNSLGKPSIDNTLVNMDDEVGEELTYTNNDVEKSLVIDKVNVMPNRETRLSDNEQPRNSITCRESIKPIRPSRRYNLRESTLANNTLVDTKSMINKSDIKHPIILQPGKKWERSLSIYRRMTTMVDGMDCSLLDVESLENKGRKYRQSVIATMEMQDLNASLNNESIKSRRSTFVSKPVRSTVILDSNASRTSICSSTVIEDLQGFLTEDCDDTVVDLSKLSLGDSEVEVTILENFHETSIRSSTARDYVLRRCNQTDALLFDECYPDTALKNCHKIGEGVYGEVFLWRAGDGHARVLKVIPVAGDVLVNGEQQKDYGQIISEIVIAMELSALGAPIPEIEKHLNEGKGVETLDLHSVENATDVYNKVLAVRLVYGSYPSRLLDLWELYDECKGSDNDNPAILPADQHFIVLELANAGQDLESYQFNNAEQAYSLFKQVAFALAVAEEAHQFEHRDLHWGNVLIAPTEQKYVTFVVRGRAHRVASRGVRATVIDYSLSRVRVRGDGARLYCDLARDDALFDALGDYQFDVYRLMRDRLGNDWKNYEPYTNILWLHYTADKMITALRYTRVNTKVHKHFIAKLKDVKNRILNYGSATEYVLTDNEI